MAVARARAHAPSPGPLPGAGRVAFGRAPDPQAGRRARRLAPRRSLRFGDRGPGPPTHRMGDHPDSVEGARRPADRRRLRRRSGDERGNPPRRRRRHRVRRAHRRHAAEVGGAPCPRPDPPRPRFPAPRRHRRLLHRAGRWPRRHARRTRRTARPPLPAAIPRRRLRDRRHRHAAARSPSRGTDRQRRHPWPRRCDGAGGGVARRRADRQAHRRRDRRASPCPVCRPARAAGEPSLFRPHPPGTRRPSWQRRRRTMDRGRRRPARPRRLRLRSLPSGHAPPCPGDRGRGSDRPRQGPRRDARRGEGGDPRQRSGPPPRPGLHPRPRLLCHRAGRGAGDDRRPVLLRRGWLVGLGHRRAPPGDNGVEGGAPQAGGGDGDRFGPLREHGDDRARHGADEDEPCRRRCRPVDRAPRRKRLRGGDPRRFRPPSPLRRARRRWPQPPAAHQCHAARDQRRRRHLLLHRSQGGLVDAAKR